MPETCQVSVYIAVSVDGFIARQDGGLDWLPRGGEDGEDYGYHAFMDSIDAMLMGRKTFETVLSFGEWPYGDTPVTVLSRTLTSADIPLELRETVSVTGGAPTDVLAELAEAGVRHVYLDGGKTIQGFLTGGLVDRLIITTVPVLIGSGVPLFGPMISDIRLEHFETRSFPSGMVQTTYDVPR